MELVKRGSWFMMVDICLTDEVSSPYGGGMQVAYWVYERCCGTRGGSLLREIPTDLLIVEGIFAWSTTAAA